MAGPGAMDGQEPQQSGRCFSGPDHGPQTHLGKTFPTTLEVGASNLIVQTDGGRRDGDCAAAAWIIGLWGQTADGYCYEPWIAHGTFMDASVTVFAAEAIALDEAAARMQIIIRNAF
eukprot:gnl/MRDRNA2_/MRDRNA2_83144_c0_seq1.p1 gnl/MRDRNA2_/MRDRNA2_83144_c0~~gnl/MRDRNA2_/MRDRNA2_83144_c0_seq1.p1  ORF type:complete len:117 (+),score=18.35 gnl/MRDRNA2_/MRDRNA2_83144_c0_seq1:179-529(+)